MTSRIDPTKYRLDRSPYQFRQRKPWRVMIPGAEPRWYKTFPAAWQGLTQMLGLQAKHPLHDASLFDAQSRIAYRRNDDFYVRGLIDCATWQANNVAEYRNLAEHYGWRI